MSVYYRPQHSCGKVVFSQTSVILSTGGCLLLVLGTHTPGQTLPWADTPLGRHPAEQTPPVQTPPRQTATAADGTHPTGMHSCLWDIQKINRSHCATSVLHNQISDVRSGAFDGLANLADFLLMTSSNL